MNQNENLNREQKKPYTKPVVTKIAMRPEEAVLGFCKSSTSAGPIQSACSNPANCSFPGS